MITVESGGLLRGILAATTMIGLDGRSDAWDAKIGIRVNW
jgi:hypothetical protein